MSRFWPTLGVQLCPGHWAVRTCFGCSSATKSFSIVMNHLLPGYRPVRKSIECRSFNKCFSTVNKCFLFKVNSCPSWSSCDGVSDSAYLPCIRLPYTHNPQPGAIAPHWLHPPSTATSNRFLPLTETNNPERQHNPGPTHTLFHTPCRYQDQNSEVRTSSNQHLEHQAVPHQAPAIHVLRWTQTCTQ
jgi:hypothetical protein